MTFLDPVAGIAGLALVAIVALYFLKARRPAHSVSSTLWWRSLTLDHQAAVPWQRLRLSWLLALQALAVALVVGALLQPALVVAQALGGQTVVVIDASETMQATDVAPSRFAVAVADARALVNRLGPHARMTIVVMTADPEVLASTIGERQPLLGALSRLRPSAGPADLADALQLAVAAAGRHPSGTRLIVLSDGITEPLIEPVTLPFPVQYRRIGVSGENYGVTALTVLPGVTGESAVAHVQDFGTEPARLTVEMFAGGHLADAQGVFLSPGAGQDVTFAVPPGTPYVRVTLLPGDDLPADNSALAVTSPPAKVRVLLVTAGDVFLQKALALRPDVALSTEAPSAWRRRQASSPDVDLFVFDRFVPPVLPAQAPYLVVGPPADRRLGSGGAIAPGPLVPTEADDPLLYDVDLSNVDVALSADLRGSTFGTVVISSPAGPVLMVNDGGPGEPPAAVLGIYLHDSDLVLRTAFPILVTHLSELLAPDAVPSVSQQPGATVTLTPGPGAREVLVTRPDGHTDVLSTRPASLTASGATVLFSDTGEIGLYKVTVVETQGPSRTSYLAVNAPGTAIAPAQRLEVTGAAGVALPKARLDHGLWPIVSVAALVVLLVEWLVYHRAR
jgi:Ca-activated chloride channel homolog